MKLHFVKKFDGDLSKLPTNRRNINKTFIKIPLI